MKLQQLFGFTLGALLFSNALLAQENPLISELESYRVIEENGVETTEPVESASPGDLLEYRLLYTNVSERPLSGLVITGPVPDNTAYQADTATASVDAPLTVSVGDGEGFQPEPVVRRQMTENGEQEVVLPPEDYTQLRWAPAVAIEPGTTQTYRYRVRVE